MNCNTPGFPALHRVCSNSYSLSQWGHPTILPSVTPFSSYPQSFPASGPFPVSWLFASGGQSIGASASASVLPMNIQGWFPLGLTGLISLLSKELSRVLSSTSLKTSILQHSAFYMVQFSHPYMTTGKARALTMHTFVSKMMTLLFNASSRFFKASYSSKEQASFNFYSWVSWNNCQSHIHGGVIKGPLFIPQLGLWGIGKLSKSRSYSIVSGPRLTPCQPHSIPAKWMPFFLLNSVPNLSFIALDWWSPTYLWSHGCQKAWEVILQTFHYMKPKRGRWEQKLIPQHLPKQSQPKLRWR